MVEATRDSSLYERAAGVLRANDLGGWTKAAPRLYPHQWSWDSAFIAIGWAHLDPRRAAQELETILAAQWATGKVPHIVFNPDVPPGSYFPDADRWACAELSPDAPRSPRTSGLCQPPVHAIAALHVWNVARQRGEAELDDVRSALVDLFPRLVAWHRYLLTARDPEGSGLVTVFHPWESADNSPRWDAALDAIEVGDLLPYQRFDLQHVADPSQRPTKEEYDRYLWLVELMKQQHYDDAAIYRTLPFLIKDVFFSAILIAANEALRDLAVALNLIDGHREEIDAWITRGRRGLEARWDLSSGLCLDYDLRAGAAIPVRTFAVFAPLVAGGLHGEGRTTLLAIFDSPDFTGHPELRWPLPPSTSPNDPAFRPRSYWRGPVWPVINWVFWWALRRAGETARAEKLRRAALDQIHAVGFAEYVEPFTGELLGSADQSWTAAVTLDWLAMT
ncbi:MAG: glucosylglycerate hydrolase [Thermomicrobiales bacterium]